MEMKGKLMEMKGTCGGIVYESVEKYLDFPTFRNLL